MPGEQFEERRLARAIAADQRQSVTGRDEQVEMPEQPAAALYKAEVFISEDWGGHGSEQCEAR